LNNLEKGGAVLYLHHQVLYTDCTDEDGMRWFGLRIQFKSKNPR